MTVLHCNASQLNLCRYSVTLIVWKHAEGQRSFLMCTVQIIPTYLSGCTYIQASGLLILLNLTLNSTSRMSSQSFSCFEKSQKVTLFGREERGPNYQEPVQFPLMTRESEDCYWGETGNYVCACVSVCVCVAFVKKMNNVAGCESAFGLRQINLQLAFWIVTAKLLIHFLLDWQRCWPESYLLMFIKSFLEWHHPSTQASFWLLLIGS